MSNRLAATSGASRRRTSWTAFWIISILGLSLGLAGAYASGIRSSLAPIVLGGLIVIGLSAALFGSMLSPLRDHSNPTRGLGGSGVAAAGIVDAGGFGGGSGDGGC